MLYCECLIVISENLRLLRRLFGFSQNAVAEASELSRSSYSDIENGKICMNLYNAQRLAALYGVTLETFVDPEFASKVYDRVSF